MFDFDQIHPSHNSVRRVEKSLKLSPDHEQEIIDNLVDTVDELRTFSEPVATERIIENVPLYQEDPKLPKRYNRLSMTHAVLHDGTYKTKITVPGRTLTLEGSRMDKAGVWQLYTGNNEEQPLEHTDAIIYLRTLLPVRPNLDSLTDAANISDATMTEALWQDLQPLTDQWQDARYYTAAVSHYTPPLRTTNGPDEDLALDEGYTSSVATVVGYIESHSNTKYTCRVGTELPIDLSYSTEESNSRKRKDIHEEYRFSLELPKQTDRLRKAMAFLAIESDRLTSAHLLDLADATVRFSTDIPAVYEKATEYIKAKHLDMNSSLNE